MLFWFCQSSLGYLINILQEMVWKGTQCQAPRCLIDVALNGNRVHMPLPIEDDHWHKFLVFDIRKNAINSNSKVQWGQHGAHLGPTGPRWAPCCPNEPCCLRSYCNVFDTSCTGTNSLHLLNILFKDHPGPWCHDICTSIHLKLHKFHQNAIFCLNLFKNVSQSILLYSRLPFCH